MKGFFSWTPDDSPGHVVDVSSDAGWGYLADEYTRGYDSPQFERIIDLMRGHGAASVVVEHRYIDMDYRSEHSRFYGTTFRRYPSVTHRLHFFAQSVAPDLSNLGDLGAEYLGYSVMRPLSLSPVGRTMIGPPQELAAGVVTLVEERGPPVRPRVLDQWRAVHQPGRPVPAMCARCSVDGPAPRQPAARYPSVKRPGSCGGIDPTERWSHASTEEVPGRAAGAFAAARA